MNIINLTPHVLNVQCEDGTMLELAPVAPAARCEQREMLTSPIEYAGKLIPTSIQYFGQVSNLPEPTDGTIYVVSRLVAEALPHPRRDVYIPGPGIRDEAGRVVGCRGLSFIED